MVFLTGGTGFLGRRVVHKLAANAGRVVCLARRLPEPTCSGVSYVTGDLADSDSYSRYLEGCETILHLAAVTGKQPPSEYFRINRDGTDALLKAAHQTGIGRFIFISSIAAKFNDRNYPYAQSKLEAESSVKDSGLRWTIIRPTMILGKGSPVGEGLSKLAGLPVMPVFGNGKARVQPVFVGDVANLLAEIVSGNGYLDSRTIELGGPEVLSIEALMRSLRQMKGHTSNRAIHLPAGAISSFLSFLEPVFRPILPFTAGQLASFRHDGIAEPDPWIARWHSKMASIKDMLNDAA